MEQDKNQDQDSASEVNNFCAVCGLGAKSSCGGCKSVYYCSQPHQKQDWKNHKLVCSPFKTTIDLQGQEADERGKEHLIASRDLKAGLILLEESAAFYSPAWFFHLVGQRQLNFDNNVDQLCIACGKLLNNPPTINPSSVQQITTNQIDSHYCSKCSWPLCSKACENNKLHSLNECSFFTKNKIPFPLSSPVEAEKLDKIEAAKFASATRVKFTHIVAMLRGLGLKKQQPKVFLKLKSLEEKDRMTPELDPDLQKLLLDAILQLKVWKYQNSKADASVEELLTLPLEDEQDFVSLFRVIQGEQFMLSKVDHCWGDPDPKSALYMYPDKTSLLSHSCVPNCSWTIGPPPSYKIRIRTCVPIKKGERLTLSRTVIPRIHYEATQNRRLSLLKRGINCKCSRCKDPTELGLFSSAIACSECQVENRISPENNLGYLLPLNPLLAESSWKCNNINCNHQIDFRQHEQLLNDLIDKIQEMSLELRKERTEGAELLAGHVYWDEMGNRAISFGETHGLHPNHTLMHYLVKNSVMNPFNVKQVPFSTPEIIRRRKERLLYCLRVEDKISPGLSVERARVLATILKLFYSVLVSAEWTKHMTEAEVSGGYKLFQQACMESVKFYKNEFHRPDETMNVEAEMIPKVVQLVEAMQLPWLPSHSLI